ncbi:MAG TPA: cysteine--tRNA ligase [Candidatus Limnocylindria bacterium]|nr:cysteine--tRNA ligase [Candidatus Limnocylindria bacterium]
MTELPDIRLYNSLTRRVEPLVPVEPGRVGVYTCGSTVYKYAHIGNLRTYLFGDLLHRTLEYLGYEVRYVKNITDVGHMRSDDDASLPEEDRIEQAAIAEGRSPTELAEHYTRAWLEDEALLNMLPVDVMPRATEHIGEMIELTKILLDKGLAYEVDGTIYYDVSEFPDYGKLSGQRVEEMLAGHRVEVEEDKRDPADFALWKKAGPHRLMKWPSPWGEGFPGWHIECSAMSLKHLGERFDIHTGGIDLKFPHHEDEIAQSEGALGHEVVSIWMHGEFLTLGDAKMAKSAGNIIRVADLPEKGFEPLAFRYLALTAHYRSKLDFTDAAMHAAASGLGKLRRSVAAARDATQPVDLSAEPMASYRQRFADAVTDDLAMPRALALAHKVASASDLTDPQRRALLLDFDRVLGLSLDAPVETDAPLPEGAAELLERRAAARAARDWATSDALRDELARLGVEVRDTPSGQEWTVRAIDGAPSATRR